jgi:phthiocerol/phthiodiolone dimycocerosyl transferase-like enzyme
MIQEIVETRQVGEQERLFHYLHNLGGLIASGACHIRGPLTDDLVRRAFNWLQRQHPILNSHIRYQGFAFRSVPPFFYPLPYFDTRGTTEIPIRVVTDPDPDAWKAILEAESKKPIGRGKHPRMRVVLVRTHQGAELTHMISTLDHAIADAQAGSMLNDQLFRYFANPEEMEQQPPVQIGLPPSLESGLPKKPDSGTRPYQPAIRFPKTDVPHPERIGRQVERHIGANEGEALRAAIRAHRTTMHGAIGAAFMMAAREKFGLDEMTVLSTVELRRMMKPPLPTTAFGCYIDILRTRHDLSDDFWAMAGDLSFKLISSIARDQQSASIMKLATWDVYRAETVPTMTHRRRIDGIAMTTAGETNYTGTYGPFTIEGTSGSVSVSMFGPSLFIVSFEKDGAIDLSVGYSADAMSREDVEDLSDRAIAALSLAAANSDSPKVAVDAK